MSWDATSAYSSTTICEETFQVIAVDPDGRKFTKVSRILCEADTYSELKLVLDINCELYKLRAGDKFNLSMVKTLRLDNEAEDKTWTGGNEKSLADDYEYVMHGKVWKIAKKGDQLEVYVSYGGLLMSLAGEARNLSKFELDKHVYLCMKKIDSASSMDTD
eukprot:g60095.t1